MPQRRGLCVAGWRSAAKGKGRHGARDGAAQLLRDATLAVCPADGEGAARSVPMAESQTASEEGHKVCGALRGQRARQTLL
eukprot:NODE_3853_length_736_cov_250.011747.p5 GENE.NODE_3853_length_736_cov_250.011747~~NODE_3853_length_736_cov_250.011747.p5  ORF type:complete len:81 (+),score=0.64 NODE_3853_length_736_cov_250.011747:129-371(+)